jgi:hypothetical protein
MALFTNLNQMLGRNNYPPTQELTNRWEWIEYWSGLREGKEQYVRNEAYRRGFGGQTRETYITQPVPMALSQASSNLLFGEDPIIRSAENSDQQRLNQIISENRLISQCKAAAITTSSEGGVYIKVSIDPETPRGRSVPIVQFIRENRVLPQFKGFSELVSATIVSAWEEDDKIYRLMENHYPGYITYELYHGSQNEIGNKLPLSAHPKTVGIEEEVETGVDELLVSYIPNSLSTDSPFGNSDYGNGVDDLFLAFNDATSIAHRATQAGVPLTVVPRELLDENNNLNHEQTIISVNKLADTLGEGDISKMVETIQHQAQQDKFMEYAKEVLDLLLIFSGISPQSVGRNIDGGAVSGTALKLKMASTLSTAAGKAAFFEDSLSHMLRLAAILDQETIGNDLYVKEGQNWVNAEGQVSVQLSDGLPNDENETAQIINNLRAAGVISLQESVKRANPHMTEDQLNAEIEAIKTDQADSLIETQDLDTTANPVNNLTLNNDNN